MMYKNMLFSESSTFAEEISNQQKNPIKLQEKCF